MAVCIRNVSTDILFSTFSKAMHKGNYEKVDRYLYHTANHLECIGMDSLIAIYDGTFKGCTHLKYRGYYLQEVIKEMVRRDGRRVR